MHKFVFHNERLLPLEEVRLSPGQSGLLSGWGIFTTLRVYHGCPFAFERHWNRLKRDAWRLEMPFDFDAATVRGQLEQVLRANTVDEGCARIYFVNNRIGIWASKEPMPATDLIIYSIDRPVREGPTQLGMMEYGRLAAHPLAGTKVTSWLENVWTLEQAHHRGFEDNLLLNERREVAECTAANIYAVRQGIVYTPPLSSGCLAGVTREVLLETAPKSGITVTEKPMVLDEIYEADEVFITSTTREVQPVSRIGKRDMGVPFGPITRRLGEIFSEYVRQYIKSRQ